MGVSAYEPFDETVETIKTLTAFGIRVNEHFILGAESIDLAIAWLTEPPAFLPEIWPNQRACRLFVVTLLRTAVAVVPIVQLA